MNPGLAHDEAIGCPSRHRPVADERDERRPGVRRARRAGPGVPSPPGSPPRPTAHGPERERGTGCRTAPGLGEGQERYRLRRHQHACQCRDRRDRPPPRGSERSSRNQTSPTAARCDRYRLHGHERVQVGAVLQEGEHQAERTTSRASTVRKSAGSRARSRARNATPASRRSGPMFQIVCPTSPGRSPAGSRSPPEPRPGCPTAPSPTPPATLRPARRPPRALEQEGSAPSRGDPDGRHGKEEGELEAGGEGRHTASAATAEPSPSGTPGARRRAAAPRRAGRGERGVLADGPGYHQRHQPCRDRGGRR